MLGKLLKYELMASARAFFPFYIALLALGLANIIAFNAIPEMQYQTESTNIHMVFGFIYFAYYLITIALSVITLVIIINRFRKALLGNEGYLMFTLPVTIDMHILSKFISALIWIFLSAIIMSGTSSLLLFSVEEFRDLFQTVLYELHELQFEIDDLTHFFDLSILEMILACALFGISITFASLMLIYCSLSLGHLASKRKFLVSVVFFLVVSSISNITMQIQFFSIFFNTIENFVDRVDTTTAYFFVRFMPFAVALFPFLIVSSCIFVAFSIIFYFTTRYILKNKLNLE